MQTTYQTKDMTILQHVESVFEYTKKLIAGDWNGLKIPDWFKENHTRIISNIYSIDIIKKYNIYHDCGKPFCLEIDSEGKSHFPNHAQISKETYQKYHPNEQIISDLIGYDMALHTKTAEEIIGLKWDIKTAMTLLLTSLAEIHSNANLFDGITSDSFKIKWKKIDKRGKMLIKRYFNTNDSIHPYVYVIVRNNLSDAQKAVQGTHASIELARNSMDKQQEHPSVIYVVVKDERKLIKVAKELLDNNINIHTFREPDIGYEMTSIVTQPLIGEQRKILQRFQLL